MAEPGAQDVLAVFFEPQLQAATAARTEDADTKPRVEAKGCTAKPKVQAESESRLFKPSR